LYRAVAWFRPPAMSSKPRYQLWAFVTTVVIGRGSRHRRRLARRRSMFPPPPVIVVGDSGYGPRETARFGRQHRRSLTLGRKGEGEAALEAPPPPRPAAPGDARVSKATNWPPPSGRDEHGDAYQPQRGVVRRHHERPRGRHRPRPLGPPRGGARGSSWRLRP
jgi:hypothetical protein